MNFAALVKSPRAFWLLLALPSFYMVGRYATGAMTYGEFVHITGDFSAQLLIATLSVTPLRLMFPGRYWTRWLLLRRRYLGVASFVYAGLHLGAYLLRQPVGRIVSEAIEAAMAVGWVAFVIYVPLAMTSNGASVRRLGVHWKKLHRWVYPAALLVFAHWVLTAFDPVTGVIHLAVLGSLQVYRVWKDRIAPSRRPRPAQTG